jgi:hypothetical protein
MGRVVHQDRDWSEYLRSIKQLGDLLPDHQVRCGYDPFSAPSDNRGQYLLRR